MFSGIFMRNLDQLRNRRSNIDLITIIFKFIPNELLLLLARDNNIHTVNMINMFSNKRNNIINRNSCRLDVRNCLWSCTIGNRIFHISFQGISFAINKNFKGSLMLFSNLNYTFNGSRCHLIFMKTGACRNMVNGSTIRSNCIFNSRHSKNIFRQRIKRTSTCDHNVNTIFNCMT